MKEPEDNDKSNLSIRLVEPAVYLKDVDFSGKRRTHISPPSMVRGILSLHLSKPTKICSIGIELTAKSNTCWPEVVGDQPDERLLYSSSTIYFSQEAEGHQPRRCASSGPTVSTATTRKDDASSFEIVDHEDGESSHAQRPIRDLLASRRGVSVDLHNYHRDIVSHHPTSHVSIPIPDYTRSAENTSSESPASSSVSLSATHPTRPPRQASSSRVNLLFDTQSNPSPDQRDRRITIPGPNSVSTPPPASRRRVSQALEDFRRALSSDLHTLQARPTPPQVDTNASVSSTLGPTIRSLSNESSSRSPSSRTPVESGDDAHRGRKRRSGFSLSAISDVFLHSVKPNSLSTTEGRAEEMSNSLHVHDHSDNGGEAARGRSWDKQNGLGRDLSHTLTKVGEVLGLEHEEEGGHQHGWKEFKKGTYRYPISFSIPADSPPSLDCASGSVVWILKATVHRPGKFIPRMESVHTIDVVATSSEDDIEGASVTVEKTWGKEMAYSLSIIGRTFPIGNKIPIQLTIQPLAKIQILKVSVAINECFTYYSHNLELGREKVAEHPIRRVIRWLEWSDKVLTPILPLTGDLRDSPLYALVRENIRYEGQTKEERTLELQSEWMKPGPWTLCLDVEIPNAHATLHPTNMSRQGDITVSHVLMITIRVEKKVAGTGDRSDRPKRRVYDIVLQYPIRLLSYLCNQKSTSLPPYSLTLDSSPSLSSRTGPSSIVLQVTEELEPIMNYVTSTKTARGHIEGEQREQRERLNNQFERLMTGQETETGEPPPSYKATTPSVQAHHPGRV